MEELRQARADAARAAFAALNSVVAPAVQAGVANPLPVGSGVIVLEVTGRVSGQARRVPLLASRLGSKLVVSTTRRDSKWLRNVESNPDVTVWLWGKPRPATATVTRGPLNLVLLTLRCGATDDACETLRS